MVKVYETSHPIEAQLILDQLRAGGLHAEITGSLLSGAIGELPAGGLITIWIHNPQHVSRAQALIAQHVDDLNTPVTPFSCPHCQALIDGHFSLCWQCQKPLPQQ